MEPTLEKYDPKKQYDRPKGSLKTGGYLMKYIKTEAYMKAAKNAYNQVKDKIAEGKLTEIVNLAKPVETSDPSTYLENIGNEMSDSYIYYQKAFEAKDPVTSLKWMVIASIQGFIASLHRLQGKLPLDPLTGETFQGVLKDGTHVDIECLSWDPPKFYLLATNKKTGFKLVGNYHVRARPNGVNSILGGSTGYFIFRTKAGHTYRIAHGDMVIDNVLAGEPTFHLCGEMNITCQQLGLQAITKFDSFKNEYVLTKVAKSIFGMFSSHTDVKPCDGLSIQIVQTTRNSDGKEQKKVLSKGSGSWLSHIEFDGYIYWKNVEQLTGCDVAKILLPSDSRIREDRRLMIQEKMAEAQKAKIKMEAQERVDNNLRKVAHDNYLMRESA